MTIASTPTQRFPLPFLRCCQCQKTSEEHYSASSFLLGALGGKFFHDLLALTSVSSVVKKPVQCSPRENIRAIHHSPQPAVFTFLPQLNYTCSALRQAITMQAGSPLVKATDAATEFHQ